MIILADNPVTHMKQPTFTSVSDTIWTAMGNQNDVVTTPSLSLPPSLSQILYRFFASMSVRVPTPHGTRRPLLNYLLVKSTLPPKRHSQISERLVLYVAEAMGESTLVFSSAPAG